MSQLEFLQWGVYHARRGQAAELEQKMAASRSRRGR
jgi:hypothetical protein